MYADILKGCKPKAKKAPAEAMKEEVAGWFGVTSKGMLTSMAKRVVSAAAQQVQANGKKTIPAPPPKAESAPPAGGRKTIQPVYGSRKEESDFFQGVLKTSEGARKAWLTRSGKAPKPSGSKTLDAIRASGKADEAARAQYRAMAAEKKGPKVLSKGPEGTKYAVMPKKGTKKSATHNQFTSDLGLL